MERFDALDVEKRYEAYLGEVFDVFEKQALDPPRIQGLPDEGVAKFSAAAIQTFRESEPLRARLIDAIVYKRNRGWEFGPQETAKSFEKAYQAYRLSRQDVTFPWPDYESYLEHLRADLTNRESADAIFHTMMIHNVATTVPTRAAPPKMSAHALRPERTLRSAQPYAILDVGSGGNYLLAMLEGNLAFPRIEVGRRSHWGKRSLHTNPHWTDVANRLLAEPIMLGESFGLDIQEKDDPFWSYFLQACRLSFAELHDEEKIARDAELEAIIKNSTTIQQRKMNFADLPPGPNEVWTPGRLREPFFDLITFSACLYQNTPEHRRQMFDNALGRLKPDGLIIVQDFVHANPLKTERGPADQLKFYRIWYDAPFKYTTLIYDAEQPEAGFQTMGRWNNGRCEQLEAERQFAKHLGKLAISA